MNIATTYRAFLPTGPKRKALTNIVAHGLPRQRLQLFDAGSGPAVAKPKGESNEVLTNVLVDGAIGTAVGVAAGAETGVEYKSGWLSDLVREVIASGQVVLVVETRSEQETAIAREIIGAAVSEFKDTVGTT
jgi:hypothetical protein